MAINSITGDNDLPMATIASLQILNIENKPLKVLFKLFDVVSLNLNLSVKFLKPSVNLAKSDPLIESNTSEKASFTGLTTDNTPSNAFLIPSIKFVRPPKSFQSFNTLLRASADLLINPVRVSLTLVHKSLASSKSPMIILQLEAQPVPKASFKVPIKSVNVLTLVAASVIL